MCPQYTTDDTGDVYGLDPRVNKIAVFDCFLVSHTHIRPYERRRIENRQQYTNFTLVNYSEIRIVSRMLIVFFIKFKTYLF